MFDINNTKHAEMVAIMREEFDANCTKYRKAALAKEAAANGGKTPDLSLKAMASLEADDITATAFQEFENVLADITDAFDEALVKGSEHTYANMAMSLRAMADLYETSPMPIR